jgi:hypothetical protein
MNFMDENGWDINQVFAPTVDIYVPSQPKPTQVRIKRSFNERLDSLWKEIEGLVKRQVA